MLDIHLQGNLESSSLMFFSSKLCLYKERIVLVDSTCGFFGTTLALEQRVWNSQFKGMLGNPWPATGLTIGIGLPKLAYYYQTEIRFRQHRPEMIKEGAIAGCSPLSLHWLLYRGNFPTDFECIIYGIFAILLQFLILLNVFVLEPKGLGSYLTNDLLPMNNASYMACLKNSSKSQKTSRRKYKSIRELLTDIEIMQTLVNQREKSGVASESNQRNLEGAQRNQENREEHQILCREDPLKEIFQEPRKTFPSQVSIMQVGKWRFLPLSLFLSPFEEREKRRK
ncbi:hypothetical protein VNO77_22952 [Canavalia gladiata]|uniref:Uncharacterized protein n=1 Tax=Canavalia gladiata TaxID=3824 RepID=A0AAN9L6V9_CANGL